jgi:murein DD-endopeptidase MepM/ murein hydrolase activator NlpD
MTDIHNFQMPLKKYKLGTAFGVIDAAHPNGHRGCDFNGVPEGTELLAIADATVVNILFSKALGNIITLQVGDKFFSYCHMQRPTRLKLKDKVKAGDVVGLLGNTGTASSGPHLHLVLGFDKFSAITGSSMDGYKFLQDKIELEKKLKKA